MKSIDLKSLLIGVLLTSTVFFGVAASNPTISKQWPKDQKWEVRMLESTVLQWTEQSQKEIEGYEPFAVVHMPGKIGSPRVYYRKPIDKWN